MPHAEASPDDHRQAGELATEAGKLLVDLRAELVASGAEAMVRRIRAHTDLPIALGLGRRSRRAQGRG